MGLYKADLCLYIDTDEENNPRLQNTTPTTDSGFPHFKLSDFSHNNVDLSHITVLRLSNCVISEIPNTVQKLNLRQLIITHTNLEEIPSCLYSGLRSLEVLDLSHNFIRNFHVEPACNEALVRLNLSNNQMEDFPHWVLTTRCPKLQEIYYNKNCLQKLDTPRNLNIRKLEMCNSQLRDVDFLFLKKFKSLEFLDISNDQSGRYENRFKDINGLFTRFKWKQLRVLKLNNLVLSIVPEGLFHVTSLTELHLVKCDLNWIPEGVKFLKNLKILDISENGICSLPEYLTFLENLCIVRAPSNNISLVEEFYNDLEILDLYQNQLENFVPCIERIKYIDLEKNIFDTSSLACYEIYKEKRDEFRNSFDLQRTNGPIELPEEIDLESERDISVDDVSELSTHLYYDINVEDECWDEEEPICVERQRNPDVTPSDDEWNGKEEMRVKEKPKRVLQFDANEDWIFCDVEEDCDC